MDCIAIQADGKIFLGGSFTNVGGQFRNRIARLHPDGTVDSSFDPNVRERPPPIIDSGFSAAVLALALQPDGKIILGGYFGSVAGQSRAAIARINPDGTLEAGLNPMLSTGGNSDSPARYVSTIAVQTDGNILAGGQFRIIDFGLYRDTLVRFNADGSLDNTFDPDFRPDYYFSGSVQASSLSLLADGTIGVGGGFTNIDGQTLRNLARLHAQGTVDSGFEPVVGSQVYSLVAQPDGRLLLGGAFTNLAGQSRNRIGRLYNPAEVATQSLSYADGVITWLRGRKTPEVWRTTFAQSTDGVIWTDLGAGTRIPGGWRLTGVSLPVAGMLRARGEVVGDGSSGWFVEAYWPPQPRLIEPRVLDATSIGFTLLAETNASYRIETSSNLVSWREVLHLTNPPSVFPVVVPISNGGSHEFFRAITP